MTRLVNGSSTPGQYNYPRYSSVVKVAKPGGFISDLCGIIRYKKV